MSLCQKCEKKVYFAEQVESSGYLFHRSCFRCAGCRKLLTLGNHSQHKEDPYCNNCYSKHHGVKSYSKLKPIVHQPKNNGEPKTEVREHHHKEEDTKIHETQVSKTEESEVLEDGDLSESAELQEEEKEHSDA